MGFEEAIGTYTYLDSHYVKLHGFGKGSLRVNQTFSISAQDAMIERLCNNELRKLTEKGDYLFIDNHFVYNAPLYVGHDENRVFKRKNRTVDTTGYYPLFMVKDFNAKGFSVSDEFMTNADTAFLSVQGLIEDPKNPFTGKPITMDEKTAHDQFIITTKKYQTKSDEQTYPESGWAVITKDINDREDWEFIDDDIVLKEHRIPEEED